MLSTVFLGYAFFQLVMSLEDFLSLVCPKAKESLLLHFQAIFMQTILSLAKHRKLSGAMKAATVLLIKIVSCFLHKLFCRHPHCQPLLQAGLGKEVEFPLVGNS